MVFPHWEGRILQKLRNPWNYAFKGHTGRFQINSWNKLPMQFTNSFCNRQQLFPPSCLFFITAKLFLARFLKRKSYIHFMFGNGLRRWGASRETHGKITPHSISVMSPAASSDTTCHNWIALCILRTRVRIPNTKPLYSTSMLDTSSVQFFPVLNFQWLQEIVQIVKDCRRELLLLKVPPRAAQRQARK